MNEQQTNEPRIRGKRLLILGGNPETGVLVQFANSMGAVTIVVDPNPDAPAKQFASERNEIDGLDIPALIDFAKDAKVDGVLVGVADILVGSYQKVCAALDVPCYASPGSVAAFTTKDGFRAACKEYGIPGIPSFTLDSTLRPEDVRQLHFPVMLKPVDNGGGVGMVVCQSETELPAAVRFAMAHSKRGGFLTERFMNCDDTFVYYTFVDGEVLLSAMADRHTTKKQGNTSPVCIGATYPSKHLSTYVDIVHPKVESMLRDIGIRNGVLMIQFFVDGGSFYAYDPGFRLQGEAPHIVIDAVNHFDHRKMLVSFALTGSMGVPDIRTRNDPWLRGKKTATIWMLLSSGTIGRIQGIDVLKSDPSVVFVMQRFVAGDTVSESFVGNERQVFARIYLVCDDEDTLRRKILEVHSKVLVEDVDGRDMVIDRLHPDAL